MTCPLVLVAAGGLGREVAEAARTAGRAPLGFVDDDPSVWGAELDGTPVLGGLSVLLEHPHAQIVLCAGSGRGRSAIARRIGDLGVGAERYASVVHPAATIPPSCHVGAGSVVLAGTVLTASVRLGQHVVCMPNVTLTHDDHVEDFATLCAGVTLGGSVRIGQRAYLGMLASVRENVAVGADATLGMGSVLLEDLPASQTWVGHPAAAKDSGTGRRGQRAS